MGEVGKRLGSFWPLAQRIAQELLGFLQAPLLRQNCAEVVERVEVATVVL